MNRWTALAMGAMFSAAVLSGCGLGDAPVSPSSVADAPQRIDPALVGMWYHVGTNYGIRFNNDASCTHMFVSGNTLHVDPYADPEIGNLLTAPDGKCTLTWQEHTAAGTVIIREAGTYELRDLGTTLVLSFGDSTAFDQGTYARTLDGTVSYAK